MDVTSVFLSGDLKEIFMKQAEGFEVKGKEQMVYKLKKVGMDWNSHHNASIWLNQQLKKLGFTQLSSDPSLYISNSEELFIIAVYIDNMLPRLPGVKRRWKKLNTNYLLSLRSRILVICITS